MTPTTTDTDIASYGATGLPPGLGIDAGTGVISGTPDTADTSTASATVTVTDTAGNAADASITLPAVAKGDQTLTGFAYSPATVTYGDTAPAVTAPGGVQTTLSYSATPVTVCTVDASTGALTLVGAGACEITATAAGAANYNEATAAFAVTVQAAGVLALNLDAIATDDRVNIAEKAAGFTISGATGSEAGVTVSVTIGTESPLTATSGSGGAWSVAVAANAAYITGTSVAVTVAASKTGFTSPSDVTRALAVDLTAPAASYTAPSTLQVGVAIGTMTPSTTATDIAEYGATGLPSGLSIDTTTGVISGTPDTADASTASATVTVTDMAGNAVDVPITFPAVAEGDQTLTGFAYSPATVTYGDTAPAVTAPGGVQTTLSYSATPPGVCTVDASTGALTLVGVGACEITATAAGAANYNEATAAFAVTVQAAGVLALSLDAIATDDRVNIAEKAAGFTISGATGSEAGVTVSVTIGTESPLTATSGSGGAWSVAVAANAAYLTGASVAVTVSASKTGFTSPSDVTRTLAVDLTAPAASYTAPSSLKVGVAIGAMTPSTTATDIAEYSATGLPSGLGIDTGTGVISGTPDTADASTASATVTVTDTAGNAADASITLPAVAKGDQTLTGFAYSPATVTYGDTAPAVTAPGGVQTTLSYSATPATVCTVDASTGALTLVGAGACEITATAAGAANYNEATAAFAVTVQAAGVLALNLDAIAGDDTVNIAEKAAGFTISGATGSEAGVSVTVTVGGTELTATSGSGGAWSVAVAANAAYITGTSVAVTVAASKTGFTSPSDVTRTLAVDLTAPAASYTAPSSLQVGVAIGAMTPSTTATDIAEYGATGLPSGLGIDTGTGVISGTPDTADASTASATVTVKDTAGNAADASITLPAVAKGDQTLTGFAYSPATVTYGDTAPAVTAPGGVQTTLSYSATPVTVCTVDASTGALTLVGAGACEITATAAGAANYNEATAAFAVTVQAAGVLALSLDAIATDDTVNIAEKAAGFTISGATGSEAGVTVSVTIGTESPLTATSGSGGAWSVAVAANAAYITGASVAVTVSASKTGLTSPSDVMRTLAVDLTAPAASYTAPSTLQVGVAIGAMTPTTTDTDIASYGATGLPPGLGIDTGTGVISGTPDTADASTASATVTVKDTAGNAADASITLPAVAKGDQTLTGFAYSPATVTYGDTAPAVTAPGGVQTTLSYSATPATVCTVDASTGALTLVGAGACEITATAAGTANYNEATASFSVTVQAAGVLALSLDAIATDNTVNIAEKAAGFAISGATGSEAGVTVSVTIGTESPLTATSGSGGAWSVAVAANAAYITGASVAVTVSASKTGLTSPSDVMRTLAVDLTAPAASYTAPGTLKVGVAIGAMTPSTTATDIAEYSATGLPPGLGIDTGTGVISGTPDTADASTASATVTVTDTAGNAADASITLPAVAKGDQTLTGFAYSPATVTYGDTAPAVTAPGEVQTTLSYSATPVTVCTVDASTGALTLVGAGACEITATAAGAANYNEATASFSVTVQAAGVLALSLDAIATDNTVNIAEKAAGFAISGDTGSEAGVTVTVGGTELTATSAAGGAWSVDVPANAAYITGASVAVTVSASKTGLTSPSDVMRTLAVDLTAPAASYTAPSTLQVGVAIGAMTPSTTATDIAEYSATGLPSGLGIDTGTGVISGTPDAADANTAAATVTVTDRAGNPATVSITFPAVANDDTEAPDAPDAPGAPSVSAASATSLTATWTEPGLNGGPAITGYNVEYRVSTATTWDDWTHTDTATTTTITGLTADTEYQVQVRALNGETQSDWSDPSDAVSTDTETIAEEAEDRLQEINCAMDGLDDASDARCNGIEDGMPGSYLDLVALQFQVIGQLPPGEYDYYDLAGWQTLYKMGDGRVIITRGGGAWTEDLTPARAPRDLEAKATGEGIVLSWQAPKAASDEVTDYRVLRRRPEEGEPVLRVVVADIGGTARAWTDTGVEEGVRYTYRVMAVRGRELSGVSNARSLRGVAMADSGPEAPAPLTAAFEGLPEAHDGEEAFHFRVAFSEDIGIGFRSMRDDSFTVDGGEVTGARRVDGRHDLWRITVEPGSDEAMTVALAGGRECGVSGAICTRGENWRQLANTPAATVAGPVDEAAPAVLTASFVEAPHEHDGETAFELRIGFSEGISIGFRTFRDQSLSVSGGSVKKAKRVDRRRDLWEVTVKPGSLGDVTVTLEGGRACGTAGAVCTGDGRALSATISTTVPGPAALSVADARVREAEDALLVFEVTLDRARHAAVTVDYVTSDVTARAGEDYTSARGTLTFATGERSKTVEVTVLDDAHDEGEETLTLALSNPSGAYLADATPTSPTQRELCRFSLSSTTQVIELLNPCTPNSPQYRL